LDPKQPGWFDIYGEEDASRAMGTPGQAGDDWNVMCAACHNTRLRKHYQESTDSYSTSMAEMSVGL